LSEQNNNTWIAKAKTASAAEKGDPKAQLVLGWYYYIGRGVPRDRYLAVEWYERAASKGQPEAQRLLGLLPVKPDMPMITDVVMEGWPARGRWKSASMACLAIVLLTVIASLSYYSWRKNSHTMTGSANDIHDSIQRMLMKNEPDSNVDKRIVSAGDTGPEQSVVTELASPEMKVTPKGPNPIIETTEQETVVNSNSAGKDPNSTPRPRSKSAFEELTELAEKWLVESPNAIN
jgi:hypothetical protein